MPLTPALRPSSLRGAMRSTSTEKTKAKAKAEANAETNAGAGAKALEPLQGCAAEQGPHVVDTFDKPPRVATFRTKQAGFSASAVFFGAEFAVKVNHIDPLNEGRKDVKLTWANDGVAGGVDLESVLLRRNMGKRGRFELQGPGLSVKASNDGLPLKARFIGIGLATEYGAAMSNDTTPPKVEIKVEVKITDRSIASLAALAGATAELTNVTTQLAGTEAARFLGTALLGAIPVVSGAVAVISARRAVKELRSPEASTTSKVLAVGRALADATCVVLPLVGTLANIGLVMGGLGLAWWQRRKAAKADEAALANAHPPTGPPPKAPAAVAGDGG